MQMFYQKKNNNKKIKKSHLLLIGSLFIFIGCVVLSSNFLLKIKSDLFSEMKILLMNVDNNTSTNTSENNNLVTDNSEDKNVKHDEVIDYSKYLGVLEIPRISLKRGFYNFDSKYNNIEYNVTLIRGSQMPDVAGGNLILMAHSGDAYISYFAYLYKLNIGDYAYITYNNIKYQYKLVNIYEVEKNGQVSINRNYDNTTLTLITCTKDDDYHQTVYIFELI